jgi:hypothetical protein
MKKIILLIASTLLVFGALGLSYTSSDAKIYEVAVNTYSSSIPDTTVAKDIIKTVERSYEIEAEAARSFDISQFPAVFINDPRFNLDPYTLDVVRQLSNRPDLESAGWLDYKIAYYSWRFDSILNAEKLKEKTKVENRELTNEEKKSLVDPQGRTAPARSLGSSKKMPLTFISLDIKDDVATVLLNDGTYTAELTLILVDGNWYIAGFKGISINF